MQVIIGGLSKGFECLVQYTRRPEHMIAQKHTHRHTFSRFSCTADTHKFLQSLSSARFTCECKHTFIPIMHPEQRQLAVGLSRIPDGVLKGLFYLVLMTFRYIGCSLGFNLFLGPPLRSTWFIKSQGIWHNACRRHGGTCCTASSISATSLAFVIFWKLQSVFRN